MGDLFKILHNNYRIEMGISRSLKYKEDVLLCPQLPGAGFWIIARVTI